MGIKQDIESSLKDYSFTKIDGQPSDKDVANLMREMTEMLASKPTTNGGGSHGHIGMIIDDAEYCTFSNGNQPFSIPMNPGPYPTTVDPDPATRGDLDYMDVSELINELTKPWEVRIQSNRRIRYTTSQIRRAPSHRPHLCQLCTFIVARYAKRSKGTHSTAKSVGFSIANSATTTTRTAEEQAKDTTWAIGELANALTTAQKKEFDQLTAMFNQMMQKLGQNPNPNPQPNPPNGTQGGGGKQPRVPCVHCRCKHGRPNAQYWELESNKSSRPAAWKPIAERRANKTE
eukprot:CCRYP_016351-RA/>CCRYP_016351-RA protein AED:0.40 eAED:0.40 QI:0/0/0/1/1/1/3/0/287